MQTEAIQKVEVSQIVEPDTILRIYKDAEAITNEALAFKVTDYQTSDQANILAKRINTGMKAWDALRKKILEPTKAFTRRINELFKVVTDMGTPALEHLDRERDNFRRKEAAKQAEEEAKAHAEEARRQKISVAKGGDGSSIKPVEKPVDQLKARSTDTVRRIPDRAAIQTAIDKATKDMKIECPLQIAGVRIYAEWKFEIYDNGALPEQYKKNSYIDA